MKIAIIGSGNVGKALGASFVRAGNSVIYAAVSADSSRMAAKAVGGTFAGSVREAAEGAEMVVIAVPYASAAHWVATEMAPVVSGKIVIDVTNPLKADYSGLATEGGPSGAENFAAWLPGAHVVKAFNTLFASVQADPKSHGVEIDALFATDDQDARAKVGALLRSLGFRPVYVGPLARARELEAMAFMTRAETGRPLREVRCERISCRCRSRRLPDLPGDHRTPETTSRAERERSLRVAAHSRWSWATERSV
jgi:predicted dinucleotide-binding enzyme